MSLASWRVEEDDEEVEAQRLIDHQDLTERRLSSSQHPGLG
jgi:hypothetical protein